MASSSARCPLRRRWSLRRARAWVSSRRNRSSAVRSIPLKRRWQNSSTNTTSSPCPSSTSTTALPASSRRTTSSICCAGRIDVRVPAIFRSWRARLALLLAVVGPGIITANVDNDAGGIYTYSLAGAKFGYTLLWTMIPITIALIVVQEMAARMGAVTGKGLSDLIRERFGLRATFLLMVALVVTNFGNVVAEFAGVASSLELFHVSKYIVVPAAAALVWGLVVRGTYQSVEKIFLAASAFYVCYIVAGVLAHPDWRGAAQALRPLAGDWAYLLFAAGLFNASLFAASILPISTAYAVCEGMGLEAGLDKRFDEAPAFYWLYTILTVVGAGVLLIPHFPLVRVMILSQVVNGAVLPFVLIFMLTLVTDPELMGEHANSPAYNAIAWATCAVMMVLTAAMLFT